MMSNQEEHAFDGGKVVIIDDPKSGHMVIEVHGVSDCTECPGQAGDGPTTLKVRRAVKWVLEHSTPFASRERWIVRRTSGMNCRQAFESWYKDEAEAVLAALNGVRR